MAVLRNRKNTSDEADKTVVTRPTSDSLGEVTTSATKAQSAAVTAKKEGKAKKIFVRTIVGGLLVIFFNFLMWAGHLYVGLFVLFLQTLIFRELVAVRYIEAKEKEVPLFRTIQWMWFWAAAFYGYGDWLHEFSMEHQSMHPFLPILKYHEFVSMVFYSFAFILSVLCMKPGCYRYQVGQLSWTMVSILLILGQMRFVTNNIFNGLFWFFIPSSVVITNDIMAYFCGLLLGRRIFRQPFLSISPNKTWEGYFGAIVYTVIYGFVMSGHISQFQWFICPVEKLEFYLHPPLSCTPDPIYLVQNVSLPTNYLHDIFPEYVPYMTVEMKPIQMHGAILALLASIVGPFGGFLASAIKRAYAVKDFAGVIPGHGGITDRMDCQLQMCLITWVYYSTFIHARHGTPTKLLASAMILSKEDAISLYQSLGEYIRTLK